MAVSSRTQNSIGLPDNAYTEPSPQEVFNPYVPDETIAHEITLRSVSIGLAMAVVFMLSVSCLGMDVGTVFEDDPWRALWFHHNDVQCLVRGCCFSLHPGRTDDGGKSLYGIQA